MPELKNIKSFKAESEVRCPNCDWFQQWGPGWEDRTSYFRQSFYNPRWPFLWDWMKDKKAGKGYCPRCMKSKVVYIGYPTYSKLAKEGLRHA